MTLIGFRSANHPQQVARRGSVRDVDDRATDPLVFAELHERFTFTIDVAASTRNARLPRFWTRDDDALVQSWAGESVWCNPPYSAIAPWVEKAWRESSQAARIVMILPANRTEQDWWQTLVEPYRDRPGSVLTVEFLRGRIRFIRADKDRIGPNERPPFGCCLLIWTAPPRPSLEPQADRLDFGSAS